MDSHKSSEKTFTDNILLMIAKYYENRWYPLRWMNKYSHIVVPLGNLGMYSILFLLNFKFTNIVGLENDFPRELFIAMYISYFILIFPLLFYIYLRVIPSFNTLFPTEQLKGDTLILLIHALTSGMFFTLAIMNLILFEPILKAQKNLVSAIVVFIGLILTILNYKLIDTKNEIWNS